MWDTKNFHHLLVVDEHKKLSGVVSDRDRARPNPSRLKERAPGETLPLR
jgi:Mg/Co/Ni transporter MgtE